MAAPTTNPFRNSQEDHLAEPVLNKDDSTLDVRSISSIIESNNGASIYDATRATSNDEVATDNSNLAVEPADTRIARHMAAFLAASQAHGHAHSGPADNPPRRSADFINRPPRVHMLADKLRMASTGEVTGWSLPDNLSDFREEEPQFSFGDGSNKGKSAATPVDSSTSRFPDNVKSPVSPTLPEYPPPTRKSTPDGCPTFGSEEARRYDFRRIEGTQQTPSRNDSLLRRLFRNATPVPSTSPESHQPATRVFAEDGTAVTGSFPQRQSGHGTNVMKGDDEHPFHQTNLPFAQADGAIAGADKMGTGPPGPSHAFTSPSSSADEATLRWLQENLSPPERDPPPPLNNAHDSMSSAPGDPGVRPDSFHTARSRGPASHAPWIIRQGRTMLDVLSPTPTHPTVQTNSQETQTTRSDTHTKEAPPRGRFLERIRSILCFCCYPRGSSQNTSSADHLNPNAANTTTQDTYVTARDHVSNESQQQSPTDQQSPTNAPAGQPRL